MVMLARPFLPQHPDYHPGRRLPWWSRPSASIPHAAWFRALAEVEACSPDRGGSPAPMIWRAYADIVSPPVVRYALDLDLDANPLVYDVATGHVTYGGRPITAGPACTLDHPKDPPT